MPRGYGAFAIDLISEVGFGLLAKLVLLLPIAFCLVPALGFLCGLSDRKVLPLVLLFSCGPGFLRVSESPW
jgi:hypothetical protein